MSVICLARSKVAGGAWRFLEAPGGTECAPDTANWWWTKWEGHPVTTEHEGGDEVAGGAGVATGDAGAAVTDAERAERLGQLNSLIELMRPAVQADGGDLALISADTATGVVEVQLQGACSSCAISSSTLQGGVERILRDRLPWVTEVLGGVDDSMDPFLSESMGRGGYVPGF